MVLGKIQVAHSTGGKALNHNLLGLIALVCGANIQIQPPYVDPRAKRIVRYQKPASVGVAPKELQSVGPPRKGKGSRRSRKNK